MTACGMRR